ncbi:SUKH-4 family immunity protein [Streptomyces sp. NPDC091265]|uniref:SUKH-4 family immunity protein n=1 Tax=Streptomyces sp. NPDC091265 TaxID=3365977 RepID=UPI003829322C
MPAPDPAVVHFGLQGMRQFPVARAYGVQLPGPARETLESVGVPVRVAPYFAASGAVDDMSLGMVAVRGGLARPPAGLENWLRIGTDGLAHVCVRPDAVVQAVFLADEQDMFVSSSVTTFNSSMTVLDRLLPEIATSSGLSEAARLFRKMNEELRRIDEEAFQDRESWWPRVLDDVRHTLNFPFSAAFEFIDGAGKKQIVTETTGPGRLHPEELIWQQLASDGIAAEQVRRVYCELEPCMMPGHYCAVWMQKMFPTAQFSHSFDYGADAHSRERGFKELIVHAAQQADRR